MTTLGSFVAHKWAVVIVVILLAGFALASGWSASRESATYDEIQHIGPGYAQWSLGDYRFTNYARPLMKLVAAAGVATLEPPLPTDDSSWRDKKHWEFGYRFLYDGGDGRTLLMRARLPFVLLGVVLGAMVYGWTRELWGPQAAWLALFLYAFNPSLLAHSHYANTDLGITLWATACMWGMWRFLNEPSLRHGAWTATAFGLAAVTKPSFVALVPMCGAMALVVLIGVARDGRARGGGSAAWKLGGRLVLLAEAALLAALLAIWLLYGFEEAGVTPTAAGRTLDDWVTESSPMRSMLLALRDRGLLPERYLLGIAVTANVPASGQMAYLAGRTTAGGWWYYLPATAALKTPLPLLIFAITAVTFGWRRRGIQRALLALAFPVAVYTAIAVSFGISIGYRHLLPTLPLVIVLAGRAVERIEWGAASDRWLRVAGAALVLWYAAGTLHVAPHFLSYFNELAGGPRGGHAWLVDSNSDWGQDLEELARYAQRGASEPNRPMKLSYFGSASPDAADLRYEALPSVTCCWAPAIEARGIAHGDTVAISATNLHRVYFLTPTYYNRLLDIDLPGFPKTMGFSDFLQALPQHYRPADRAGYSIFIYRLTDLYRK